jgi:HEPN domain-containing protein
MIAEKALKAYLFYIGKRKIITHSTYTLARECMQENNSFISILSLCADLDKHYIPSRYPNGLQIARLLNSISNKMPRLV